jgi:hypothetical protein
MSSESENIQNKVEEREAESARKEKEGVSEDFATRVGKYLSGRGGDCREQCGFQDQRSLDRSPIL